MMVCDMLRPLAGKLIVSCQAEAGDAFYGRMDLYAKAAAAGGAAGIRANGAQDIRAIREAVALPVIGIQKRLQSDGKVLITPSLEDAQALAAAGAAAVALDCTRRGQASGALDRLRRIRRELRVAVGADIATIEEARAAAEAGADFVLSTMRGYTDETADVLLFDAAFIGNLVRAVGVPVIAEGRIDTPAAARAAMRAGAYAVVVGSAITRPHLVTRSFVQALPRNELILGIDLGGTNTKSGLVASDGTLVWDDTTPTPAKAGRAMLLEHLCRMARRGIERQEPAAIGIATAGWVNPQSGRVVYATETLPGWTGTEIAKEVAGATGLPVYVENDANALAVGEAEFGAGRGLTDFVCITLGTGVGGGCYVGGRLNRGRHFFANALGHIVIEPGGRTCNCGQRGCLEMYTNAAALIEYGGGRYRTVEEVIAGAREGEAAAVEAMATFSRRLGEGCAILIHLLDPQALIVAGGVVQGNALLLENLRAELGRRVTVWRERELQVLVSPLGYHAGVLGAAAVAQILRD